jgi:hypothetical protein
VRNEVIEEITAFRLRQYEELVKVRISFPVPVEKIVEQVLKLNLDYDEIEEQPGEQILGALDIEGRKILVNAKHLDLFEQNPGLERSTIGHEAGHWDVDVDRAAVLHPALPGFETKRHTVNRHATKSNRLIEVLLRRAVTDPRARKLYKQLTANQDEPEVRSLVDRYQSALLMPKWLIVEAASRYDFTKWPELYRLKDEARVSISNLTTRLQRLGLIYIPEGEGKQKIYRSKDEARGQKSLFD